MPRVISEKCGETEAWRRVFLDKDELGVTALKHQFAAPAWFSVGAMLDGGMAQSGPSLVRSTVSPQ